MSARTISVVVILLLWAFSAVLALSETAFVRASRIRLLGVSCDLLVDDDSPGLRRKVARTLDKAGVLYPNLLYQGRQDPLVAGFAMPGALPFSILYGPDGNELKRWTGTLPLDELEPALRPAGSHTR